MIEGLKPYEKMKAAGLPWLANIPTHWSVTRTKYVFREVDDRSKTGEETQLSMSQAHGLIESSKIDTWRMRSESYVGGKLCKVDDVVLNRLKAHLGVFARSSLDGVISPDYSVFRPIGNVNSRYFERVLKTPHFVSEIRRFTKGIVEGFWRLYTDDFYNLAVPLPPPDEQAAIVRFLDHADRKIRRYIRAKRRLIELLNEQKQAIIHQAVTRGLDPHVKLKPSGVDWLGGIPEHWQRAAVSQVFAIGRGKVTSHEYIANHPGPFPLYSSQTTNDGVMGYIDSYMFDGDYLTWTTDGAHAGTVFRRTGKFNCTNVCGTLFPTTKLDLDFMRMAIASETKRQVRLDINPKLMNNMMARIRVSIPPFDEQATIARYVKNMVEPSNALIQEMNHKIDLLGEYRTRLIADVVTGKLDVREAAAKLPNEMNDRDGDDLLAEENDIEIELATEPDEVEA